MHDLSEGRLEPQRGPYADPFARLNKAAFDLGLRSTRPVTRALFLFAGVLVGLLAALQPTAVWITAAAVLVAATVVLPLGRRWAWPWQEVIVAEAGRHRSELARILGTSPNQRGAADWLARSPDAPAYDRYRVLGFIGHDELAEQLIPHLPQDTPEDRFWKAWAELGYEWRTTGAMDTDGARALAAGLDPARRGTAEVSIDFARAMAWVADGRDLRTLDPPVRVPLGLDIRVQLTLIRFMLTVVLGVLLAAVLVGLRVVGTL